LHALQELLEIFQCTEVTDEAEGVIQSQPVRILVDSGSTHAFISVAVASQLQGASSLPTPVKVQVADGNILNCSTQFQQTLWSVGHYQFHSDLKILPLSTYDMILGLDWLDQHSPMKVHWKHKWLSIPYQGSQITLFGENVALPARSVIQVCTVNVVAHPSVQAVLPTEIQQLIDEFATLFEVSTDLPPARSCDHTIPLVEGAAPVHVRPYRYTPLLKTEIEKQV
jgi:hypothetical protein